jgi:ankyrin repeat protein
MKRGVIGLVLALSALLPACMRDPDRLLVDSAAVGDVAGVRAALRAGAKISARNERENATALCLAAAHDHADVIRELVRAGSDVNAKAQCGAVWVIGDLTSEDPVLIYAAARGHTDAVRALVQAGADADFKGTMGTPLMLAAHSGKLAAVQVLLDAAADPAYRDGHNVSAPEWAEMAGHREVAKVLRAALANCVADPAQRHGSTSRASRTDTP